MINLLKKKWFIWLLIALPGLYWLVLPYFTDCYGAKFWSKTTKNSGIIAVSLFVLSLAINPLRILFEQVDLFKLLMRYRRNLGVAVFIYAAIHTFCFLMKKGFGQEALNYLLHPVIVPGLIAFLIFIPLTITSNNYFVRKLGHKKWSRLHELAYLAEILVFIHMILQFGNTQLLGLALFIPLFTIQYLRRKKLKTRA